MINQIIQGDCVEVMEGMQADSVDLTVTSPPYDNLRNYNGYSFDFEAVARELYRITKHGGVVVWIVADATVNGSETGTAFRQALFFKETGFNIHDTMIWKKTNPMPVNDLRYQQSFEYMFIFSKGKPKIVNLINVPKSEKTVHRQKNKMATTQKGKDGKNVTPTFYSGNERPGHTKKKNIWDYAVGFNAGNDTYASKHPAVFPELLAQDHIISWSNPGDIVFDPFMGSGTTAKMAMLNNRKYIGAEISAEYVDIARKRIEEAQNNLFTLEGVDV